MSSSSILPQKLTKLAPKYKSPLIAIIGAGSIGMLFFHMLKASNRVNPFFVEPRPHKPTPIQRNLTLKATTQRIQPALFLAPSALAQVDAVIITTKAFAVTEVAKEIKSHLKPQTPIIVATNGVGAVNECQKILGYKHQVYAAVTAHGAMKKRNTCFHRGTGPTYIGPSLGLSLQNKSNSFISTHPQLKLLRTIAQALEGTIVENADPFILNKLSANAVINPLTAHFKCSNGELFEHQTELNLLISEVAPIMKCMGLNITKNMLKNTVNTIIKATSRNYSSMEQDFIHNRPTEVAYIIMPLIEEAKRHGLKADFCHELMRELTKHI